MKIKFLLAISSIAAALPAVATPLDGTSVNFAAPIVSSRASMPGDTPFGSIIFDNSSNLFYGLGASGNWLPFGVSATSDANIHGITVGLGGGANNMNVVLGYQALQANTSGFENVAVGNNALTNNTTGTGSTAIGYHAAAMNNGDWNIALGAWALASNTSGNNNTSLGSGASEFGTTGSDNIAIGYRTLRGNTITNGNVAVGTSALENFSRTSDNQGYNTAIGYNSGLGLINGINNTIIGARVTVPSSINNNIIIADGAGNQRINVNSSGQVGIGTTSPSVSLDVNGAIRPGDSATVTTCGLGQANGEGSIRYDYTAHNMEYCNGTTWVAM